MFSLFRDPRTLANQRLVEELHEQIVRAARQPAFYTDYGVADTFQGRFELMILLAGSALSRLNAAEDPGPAVAQDLVDAIFRHLDRGLREMGVGDIAVPKRIKKLAEAFLGRSAAYDQAGRIGTEELAAAVSRNVYNGDGDGRRLAVYAAASRARLDVRTLDDCLRNGFAFPAAETISTGADR